MFVRMKLYNRDRDWPILEAIWIIGIKNTIGPNQQILFLDKSKILMQNIPHMFD